MTLSSANSSSAPPSENARRLQGFGPLGLLAVVAIFASSVAGFFVSAVLVLIWARYSATPLHHLGFRPPRNWTVTLLAGLLSGILLKLILKSVVMPLLGAPAMNAPYHYLVGNAAALPWLIITVLISASFGEEVFFRGYLFERLGTLVGTSKVALSGIILFSSALFALAHYHDQGFPGFEQAAITGVVFGGVYAWRKQIWFPMIMHAGYDLTAIAIIYWNWEETIARLVIR